MTYEKVNKAKYKACECLASSFLLWSGTPSNTLTIAISLTYFL